MRCAICYTTLTSAFTPAQVRSWVAGIKRTRLCIPCNRAYQAAWRTAHIEEVRARGREYASRESVKAKHKILSRTYRQSRGYRDKQSQSRQVRQEMAFNRSLCALVVELRPRAAQHEGRNLYRGGRWIRAGWKLADDQRYQQKQKKRKQQEEEVA